MTTPNNPPDTITTPDQLDALPIGTVLHGRINGRSSPELLWVLESRAVMAADESWAYAYTAGGPGAVQYPMTVLYRPDVPARGSADAETLRAEVERLREDVTAWQMHAERAAQGEDAARTEAATLRTAIEEALPEWERGVAALLGYPSDRVRTAQVTLNRAAQVLRAVLAAHPAPEAAPPALTVTREQMAYARRTADEVHGAAFAPVEWPITFLAALRVTVLDDEEQRRG